VIAVVDASPVIDLSLLGQFDLLNNLFSRVVVPEAVRQEVSAGGDRPGAAEIAQAGWLEFRPNDPLPPLPAERIAGLGPGELSVLAAALAMPADVAILDDLRARRAAKALDIQFTGTLGILLLAKRRGMLAQLRPHMTTMLQYNPFFTTALVNRILALADEEPIGNNTGFE
jgi:hypothetical protein